MMADAPNPTPKMDAVLKLANSPFKAYRETVTDGRTGLVSAAKNAFSGSFYVASAIMLWLAYLDKLTEAYFGLYLGAYALAKLGDKAIEHASSVLSGKPALGEAPPTPASKPPAGPPPPPGADDASGV